MPVRLDSTDLTDLAWRRADVLRQIERLLLRRDIVGHWTPGQQAEYRALRDRERGLHARTIRLRAEKCGAREPSRAVVP
jgi:hypothetical protein